MKNFFIKIWSKIKEIWFTCANFCAKYFKITWHYIKEFCIKASKHPFYFSVMILSFIVGLILLIVPSKLIVDYAYIVLGVSLIVLGFSKIAKYQNKNLINYYEGTINIVVGAFVLASHQVLTMILVALFLVALPIYRIIRSSNRQVAFKNELLYFVLGFIILFCGNFFAGLFIKVAALLLVFTAGYLGYVLWLSREEYFQKKTVVMDQSKVIDVEVVENEVKKDEDLIDDIKSMNDEK